MTTTGFLFEQNGHKRLAYLSDCKEIPEPALGQIRGVEIAVLDAARKCALKKNRLDLVQVLAMEKERLKAQVKSLLPLRNAGEPLRPQIFGRSTGQGMGGGGFGWDF